MYRAFYSLILILLLSACSTRQAIEPGSIPDQHELDRGESEQGAQVLEQLLQQYQVDQDQNNVRRVKNIVNKLSAVTGGYDNAWHVYVLKDDALPNAAATVGNYIFVWTGIFRKTDNDAQLTTVLAHEIGHVLANHPLPTPMESASEAIAGVAGNITQGVMQNQGYIGAGSQLAGVLLSETIKAFVVYPESQRKELEADHIGLFLMSKAGYDPNEALKFWEKAAHDPDFSNGISFLSTHPASVDRLNKLRDYLPKAMDVYTGRTEVNHIQNTNPVSPPQQDKPITPVELTNSKGSGTEWIIDQNCNVYSSTNEQSKVISNLDSGAKIKVKQDLRRWLEISEPVSGYVQSKFASPTS